MTERSLITEVPKHKVKEVVKEDCIMTAYLTDDEVEMLFGKLFKYAFEDLKQEPIVKKGQPMGNHVQFHAYYYVFKNTTLDWCEQVGKDASDMIGRMMAITTAKDLKDDARKALGL